MENAPTGVVEPATTAEELLVRINPLLYLLESTINAEPVSAAAEVRAEGERALELGEKEESEIQEIPQRPLFLPLIGIRQLRVERRRYEL